ncbi:hypothetical protein B1B04_21675 [Lysinibacillus sp. KCTC 33748]|nr:hypothetical protein B1B04_21675 [Lysinibacillus sp. KCTC 33748]SKC12955.1 hypothetical protein SAMN06295926_12641 [Lysinibacillus sp. AC-3]
MFFARKRSANETATEGFVCAKMKHQKNWVQVQKWSVNKVARHWLTGELVARNHPTPYLQKSKIPLSVVFQHYEKTSL